MPQNNGRQVVDPILNTNSMSSRPPITIIGAGLVGALLGTLLAQRGFVVELFERRADPRKMGYLGGRSINLALAERGMHGLRLAGLTAPVMDKAVMMRGRMVHALDGHSELLRYGRDDSEVIWSINRGQLNALLIDAAEAAGAKIHFGQRLESADFAASTLRMFDEASAEIREHHAAVMLGTDGAGSALRAAINAVAPLGERFEPLGHGYKELEIPALVDFPLSTLSPELTDKRAAGERFAIERNALHIWPRGHYMCIALPNAEGSFTVTLFLPNSGDPSFATVVSPQQVADFFARDFADAVPLMPSLIEDFTQNPVGLLGTLHLDRWHLDGRALLLGDAAHAIVPFHGQGMNCGFEDAVELADLLETGSHDMTGVFAEFESRRRPNAEAIALMALENYIEMRDSVAAPDFLLRRALEQILAERHPGRFVPRYAMVTFTRLPYATAFARGKIQGTLLAEVCLGKSQLEQIDLDQADTLVRQRLRRIDV